jgi:Lon protease-like protein
MSDVFEPRFRGRVRLFPLPDLVLFPRVVQPLHIFEPRYRQMTADALDTDRLIAMAVPLLDSDADDPGAAPLHTVACLGRIIAEQQTEDGRYNLLLRGEERIRLDHELPRDRLYREAHAEGLSELEMLVEATEWALRERLIALAPRGLGPHGNVAVEFQKLLKSNLTLSALTDIIAFALPLGAAFKQSLLEELDVERRARRLLEHLEEQPPSPGASPHFPPSFSPN